VICNISEEHEKGVVPSKEHMDRIGLIICDMFELASKHKSNVVALKLSGLITPNLCYKLNAGQKCMLDFINKVYQDKEFITKG